MSIQYHALWEILNMGGVHSPSEGQVTIPKRMNFRKSSKWPLLIPLPSFYQYKTALERRKVTKIPECGWMGKWSSA